MKKVPIKEGIFMGEGAEGILLANRCEKCSQVFFPKAEVCLSCFHEQLEDVHLSREGTLYSYTTARMPSSHFTPPFSVGFVDMPEGVRVFSPLKEVENRAFKVGMRVKLVIEKLWEEGDKEVVGYKFVPAS